MAKVRKMPKGRYKMTTRRRVALKKAQTVSARKRKLSGRSKVAIGVAGVVGTAAAYHVVSGSQISVTTGYRKNGKANAVTGGVMKMTGKDSHKRYGPQRIIHGTVSFNGKYAKIEYKHRELFHQTYRAPRELARVAVGGKDNPKWQITTATPGPIRTRRFKGANGKTVRIKERGPWKIKITTIPRKPKPNPYLPPHIPVKPRPAKLLGTGKLGPSVVKTYTEPQSTPYNSPPGVSKALAEAFREVDRKHPKIKKSRKR